MINLIHLIYISAATQVFSKEDLVQLLDRARANNADRDISGMLLFEEGSFFQILEGPPAEVERLYAAIEQDSRHSQVVTIIKEPIVRRAFGEWTMGFPDVSPSDLNEIVGTNDFFSGGTAFRDCSPGRAKKILSAFRDGRWRSHLDPAMQETHATRAAFPLNSLGLARQGLQVAFQPIVDMEQQAIISYEALLRGPNGEHFPLLEGDIDEADLDRFDIECRGLAIAAAASLGLRVSLNLNFVGREPGYSRAAIQATLDAAGRNAIDPMHIVLEIRKEKVDLRPDAFIRILDEYRAAGIRVSIDHFGAGPSSLTQLESYRPEMISLDEQLVRGIERNGPRQAIVRGLLQTCNDLGIDLVAKYIETIEEFEWLRAEGVTLFQGNLLSEPEVGQLPDARIPGNAHELTQ
ncbi:MAG: diguanylate phosphodiesterase [Chromatiales bacterium]|nr:diguanylate phosphodiesterase [Chromatiales bacterium]